jgi:hypothetical protein
MTDVALPSDVLDLAIPTGSEFGWKPECFLPALQRAATHRFACLGGQFQWVLPDGTCEAYWLNADSSSRHPQESWEEYVQRSTQEVGRGFEQLLSKVDFDTEADQFTFLREKKAAGLRVRDHLLFVAYFVSEYHDV